MPSLIYHHHVTPLQEGMLVNARRTPRAGFDLEQVVITSSQPLDPLQLAQAFAQVADRHPVLRSYFRWETGGPQTIIREKIELTATVVDWRNSPTTELARYLEQDRRAGFDETAPPLHRLLVARSEAHKWTVIWSFPHVLLDGRSILIVLDEWFALLAGRSLPPAPSDFSRFVTHVQRENELFAAEFWRSRLGDRRAPTALPVPFAAPESEVRATPGRLTQHLDQHTTARLRTIAAAHGATLNNCLQAALAVSLTRHTRDESIVFGNVRACRHAPIPDCAQLVGLLINTLPFRVDLVPHLTVGEVLSAVSNEQKAQRAHELDRLTSIHTTTSIPRDQPLFNVILMFEHADFTTALQKLHADWQHREVTVYERPNTPLTIIAHGNEQLALNLIYDEQRWDNQFAHHFAALLITILKRFADKPAARIDQLDLAEPSWVQFLATSYNATAWTISQHDQRLHDLAIAQAARTPDAPALITDQVRLSYAHLRAQAARLAHHLQEHGVRERIPVGILIPHGPRTVIAALAVMMAGGIYVPLDPAHPPERLRWILSQTACSCVISQRDLSAISNLGPTTLIDLDALDLTVGDDRIPSASTTIDDPAYIIYTSGSTGRPKGVVISHRGAVNTILDLNQRFSVDVHDRALALSSSTFDLSVYDTFGLLAAGGAVIFPTESAVRHPPAWLELLAKEKITVWNTVPALMELLLPFAEAQPQALAQLRLALFSGDWIPVTLPQRLRKLASACAVFALGGATEGSIWSIIHPTDQLNLRGPSIPYGSPLRNQSMQVVAANLTPCPPFVPGEIMIGGMGVADGYWQDPIRTNERFLTDAQTGVRWYRTGDLGRHLADGTIEFLGRLDHQVKIRGYRVELGEVEAALATHPAVTACVVATNGDRIAGQRLIAYVVKRADASFDHAQMASHVGRTLPGYMIPEALVFISALPLSVNGKVDRSLLPKPELTTAVTAYTPPVGETELRLATVWSELLGVARVGANDDFFALGGHSLLAGRLMAHWSRIDHAPLELRDVFETRTLRALAQRLDQRQAALRSSEPQILVALKPHGSLPPFFFIGGFLDIAHHLGDERPVYALDWPAERKTPAITFAMIAEQCLAAMRTVQPHGPYFLGGHCFGATVAFAIANLLERRGEQVAFLTLLDPPEPTFKTESIRLRDRLRFHVGKLIEQRSPTAIWQHLRQNTANIKRRALTTFRGEGGPAVYRDFSPAIFSGRVVVVLARDTFLSLRPEHDPRRQWQAWTHGGIELLEAPGDHITFCREPHIRALGLQLASRMNLLVHSR